MIVLSTRLRLSVLTAAVFLVGVSGVFAQAAPAVSVMDQTVMDGRVLIAKVVSAGPGFLVVHSQNNGAPGPVLGWAAVRAGENVNVVVALDASKVTPVLYAMLHVDAGTVGIYEFPGADAPARVGGVMVNPSFRATVSAASVMGASDTGSY